MAKTRNPKQTSNAKTVARIPGVEVKVLEKAEENVKSRNLDSLNSYVRFILREAAADRVYGFAIPWGDALDPDVQMSLDDHRRGNYITIRPGDDVGRIMNKAIMEVD